MGNSESESGEQRHSKISSSLRRLQRAVELPSMLCRQLPLSERAQSSNENKMSDGHRERAPIESGSVLIIGKRDRVAGRR